MMKGGKTALGEMAHFEIEQDTEKVTKEYPIPKLLKEQLNKHKEATEFDKLTSSRKKHILKYLSYIKSEETLLNQTNYPIKKQRKKR